MNTAVATKPAAPAQRSRIEGQLHRSLPCSITVLRDAAPTDGEAPADAPLRLRLSVSSETPYLRQSWWDEPWVEVLGHKAGEIDLTRFDGGGATVLANHDRYTAVGDTPLAGIGVIERASIEGGKLVCDILISRREALADLRQDIADGLVKNVSIGYLINERVLTKSIEGQPSEYRVTSWSPFEVSLVDIPADATVGLGRQAELQQRNQSQQTPHYRVVTLPPAVGTLEGTRTMDNVIDTPAEPTRTAPTLPANPAGNRSAEPIQLERERVREITALGRQLGLTTQADTAIEGGMSLDAFRAVAIKAAVDSGALRVAESPEIGLSTRQVEQFSFCRAMLAAADPAAARQLAPFEYECSRAAQDKRGSSHTGREAAITIPVDVLNRGLNLSHSASAAAARLLIQRAMGGQAAAQYRDLVAGTTTAGGHTVATELLAGSFIDLLRNALVLDRLGATMLTDLNGNIAIPSQTGAASTYWVAENGAPTESQQAFAQVTMTPKTIGAYTDYSRRLLLQSSIDVEAFVRADLAAVVARGILLAAINGSGASNQPTGILNTSGIGAVAGGTNGLAPTYANLVDLETAVAVANAAVGSLSYLTNSKVRGTLRKTQVFSGTNGAPVWTKGRESGLGDVMGYDAYVSNAVPSNLDKGTSTGVCSAIIFGNWADLLIGMWGGLDMMLDPFTGATAGTKRVVALQDLDVAVRRVASFAAMKDALTS